MLLSETVRWDKENQFANVLEKFWQCFDDEKFITARQTIQAFATIMQSTDKYNTTIKHGLLKLSFDHYKKNQKNLLKKDVANALK